MTSQAPPTPSQLWRRYAAWPAINLGLLVGSMSVAGFVLAVLGVGAGLARAGRLIAELLIGSLLTPLFILAGPGLFVAVAIIAMIGLGTRPVRSRLRDGIGRYRWSHLAGYIPLAAATQ